MWGLGVGQGLRPSELVRVRWEDIDLARGTLAVRGAKTAASSAVIPLTPLARRELERFWRESERPGAGLLFKWGGGPVKEYKRALASAAVAAGIERKVTPYLLRHSFATIAWTLGIDKDVARRIMRHTTTKMLDEVYARPRPEDLAKKLTAFDLGREG